MLRTEPLRVSALRASILALERVSMAEYPYPPRMMTRGRAAHYCDLTEAGLEREVSAGRLPLPVKLDGKDHWSRVALDEYLARIAGETAGDWRKEQPLYAA